jgi:hypothetical protein
MKFLKIADKFNGELGETDNKTMPFSSCLGTGPHVNIANITSSTKKSDSKLLDKFIENTPACLKIDLILHN